MATTPPRSASGARSAKESVREIKKALRQQQKRYKKASIGALLAEGYDIMAKSIPLVPVEFGVLRNARYVAVVGGVAVAMRQDRPAIELGYGTDYAVSVHEKLEVHHKVGQAKYLSEPFNKAKAGMRQRVAQRTKSFHVLGIGPAGIPKSFLDKPRVKKRPKKKSKKK